MRWTRFATCLWPGLPQLWWQGAWWALALAVGFAVALNLALVATIVWPQLFDPSLRNALWAAILSVWLVCVANSGWRMADFTVRIPNSEFRNGEDLFPKAIDEYLGGNWAGAEEILSRVLRRDRGDVPARLMRATLLRRTGRLDQAESELRTLTSLEAAEPWALEIQQETDALVRVRASAEESPSQDDDDRTDEKDDGEASRTETEVSDAA